MRQHEANENKAVLHSHIWLFFMFYSPIEEKKLFYTAQINKLKMEAAQMRRKAARHKRRLIEKVVCYRKSWEEGRNVPKMYPWLHQVDHYNIFLI